MRFRTARLARAGRHGEAGCFPTQTHSHPPDCSAHRLTDTSYQPRTPDGPSSLRLPAARYSSLPRTLRPVRLRLAVRMQVVPAERRCASTVDVRANACWVSRSGEQLVQRGLSASACPLAGAAGLLASAVRAVPWSHGTGRRRERSGCGCRVNYAPAYAQDMSSPPLRPSRSRRGTARACACRVGFHRRASAPSACRRFRHPLPRRAPLTAAITLLTLLALLSDCRRCMVARAGARRARAPPPTHTHTHLPCLTLLCT